LIKQHPEVELYKNLDNLGVNLLNNRFDADSANTTKFSLFTVSLSDFEKRCPGGRRLVMYKRAKEEKYAPYLLTDGLINRLSIYEDLQCE